MGSRKGHSERNGSASGVLSEIMSDYVEDAGSKNRDRKTANLENGRILPAGFSRCVDRHKEKRQKEAEKKMREKKR